MGNKRSTASLKTALLKRKKSRLRVKASSSQSYTTQPESTQRDPSAQAEGELIQPPEPAHSASPPKECAPQTHNIQDRSVFDLQYSTKPSSGEPTAPELASKNPSAHQDDPQPFIANSNTTSGATTLRPNTAESPPITSETLNNPASRPLQLQPPTSQSPPPPPETARPIPILLSQSAIYRKHFGLDPVAPPVPPLKTNHFQCYHHHRKMHKTNESGYTIPCMTCKILDRDIRWRCSFCDLRICERCMYFLSKTPGRELYMFLERMADRMQKGEAQVRKVETLASGSTHSTDRGEDCSSRGVSNKRHSKQKSKGSVTTTGSTRTGEGSIR